jgi:hypothetical protein
MSDRKRNTDIRLDDAEHDKLRIDGLSDEHAMGQDRRSHLHQHQFFQEINRIDVRHDPRALADCFRRCVELGSRERAAGEVAARASFSAEPSP